MKVDITPYETCFRVFVDGKRTGATIDFGPAGTMDASYEAKFAAHVLKITGAIAEDECEEAEKQIFTLLK